MSRPPVSDLRILRPAGALFQADLFLAEWSEGEGRAPGGARLVTAWLVRPRLLADAAATALLLEDLELAVKLASPSIVRVLDVWRNERGLVVATERVEGSTLAEAMIRAAETDDRLPPDLAIAVALEVARALEAAHEPGPGRGAVVHGDVRPENVLIGPEGEVRLGGFGFARFLPALAPRGLFATWDGWCYQPPERLATGPPDPGSDLFSLGLVLYEAVTGERPWGTDDRDALLEALDGRASPIRAGGLGVGGDLEQVVRRACAPDPAERFQTAAELAEALHGLLFVRRLPATAGGVARVGAAGPGEATAPDQEAATLTPSSDAFSELSVDVGSALTSVSAAASLLTEAGGEAQQAAEAQRSQAEQLEAEGDAAGALARYQRSLELARASGAAGGSFETHVALGLGRTALQAMRLDLAEPALHDAVALARSRGAVAQGTEAEILLLQLLAQEGRLPAVMELAKDAIPLAESSSDAACLAEAYGAIGEAYQNWGQFGPDLRYIEAAVSFAVESGDRVGLGRVLRLAVIHAAAVGEHDQVRLLLDQVRPIAAAHDDPLLRGQLLGVEAVIHVLARDFEHAAERALEGVAYARRHGLRLIETVMLHNAGDALLRLGRHREALFDFDESLRRSRAGCLDRVTELNEMFVGYLEAVAFGDRRGLDRLRRALARAAEPGRLWSLTQGHELLGRALVESGDREAGVSHLREAARFARETGVRFLVDEADRRLREAGGA